MSWRRYDAQVLITENNLVIGARVAFNARRVQSPQGYFLAWLLTVVLVREQHPMQLQPVLVKHGIEYRKVGAARVYQYCGTNV